MNARAATKPPSHEWAVIGFTCVCQILPDGKERRRQGEFDTCTKDDLNNISHMAACGDALWRSETKP